MTTPYQTAVLADGAVSYVPGNDTAYPIIDIVQSVSAIAGGAGIPTLGASAPAGLGGTALGFNRVGGGGLLMGVQNPFASTNPTQFSIEAWFSSTDSVGGSGGLGGAASLLNSDISGTGHNDWGVTFINAMGVSFGQGLVGGSDETLLEPNAYNDGAWHHVVVTWDGTTGGGPNTGTATIYVDSVAVATNNGFRNGTNSGAAGWSAGANVAGVDMSAGNWALYPSVLTPTQILDHYNLGLSISPPPCDPNFSDVVLLLHCDGSPGSSTFVDSSPNAFTVTPDTGGGSAVPKLSTLAPEYSDEYISFNVGGIGSGGAGHGVASVPITTAGPLDLTSATDWVVELAVYVPSGQTGFTQIFFTYGSGALSNGGATANGFDLSLDASGNIKLSVYGTTPGVTVPVAAYVPDSWNTVAVQATGGTIQLFVNGTPTTAPQTYTSVAQWVGYLVLGGVFEFLTSNFQNAYRDFIDEVRVTNGAARYSSAGYTPAAPPFGAMCSATVPNVVGDTLAVASAAIVTATLVVGTVTTSTDPSVPAGDIISQNPAGGTSVDAGSAVDLVESLGPPGTVPNVVNTSISVAAPAILAAAGFVVGTVGFAPSSIIIIGNVISQSPAAGSSATPGSGVNLIVSSGLPPLTIPDLFGLDEADARLALTSLGLVVGAVGTAPSRFVAPGTVMTQNGSPGTPVASGTVVSFVLSTGTPLAGIKFDFEATVISQYANSPVILQLASNMNDYVDQSTNFANFFNYVWNVLTAVGFGLDIWGRIVGVSRLLHIPTTSDYVGFDNSATPPPDWQTMGSNQPPQPAVGGQMYTGYNATQTYLLLDDAYRQLILAKAFANICTTTAPAINTILQNLYGKGSAWVLNTGVMTIEYHLNFAPSAIQLAILEQSGVIPTPPGVLATIVTL